VTSFTPMNPSDTSIDPKTPLLLGALGVSETELLLLMGLLKDSMPFSASGNCTLDRGKLSLLYRHVAVARALGIQIDDFVRSLKRPTAGLVGLFRAGVQSPRFSGIRCYAVRRVSLLRSSSLSSRLTPPSLVRPAFLAAGIGRWPAVP
jgi:hypothetical protein